MVTLACRCFIDGSMTLRFVACVAVPKDLQNSKSRRLGSLHLLHDILTNVLNLALSVHRMLCFPPVKSHMNLGNIELFCLWISSLL